MKIVVTGNMGCGKSTAVEVMMALNPSYALFDYDAAVRSMYDDPTVQLHLDMEFATHTKDEIAAIVYDDSEKMGVLQSIFSAHLAIALDKVSEQDNVIYDIPLYFELLPWFQLRFVPATTIVIASTPDLQTSRVKLRSGFTQEKIDKVLSKQMPQHLKIAKADHVLYNLFDDKESFVQHVEEFVFAHGEIFNE